MPFAKSDLAIIAAAGHARRSTLLLPAANAIRKSIVGRGVIHLRGRLVVPGTPRLAAVHRDNRALIAHNQENVRMLRIDPDLLIIVAAGRAANSSPGLAGIRGFPRHHARAVTNVWILWIHREHRAITAADSCRRPGIGGGLHPVLARVIRSIDRKRGV